MATIVLDPSRQCRYSYRIEYSPRNRMYIDLSRVRINPSGFPASIDKWTASIELSNNLPINIPLASNVVTKEIQLGIYIELYRSGDAYVYASVFPRIGYSGYRLSGPKKSLQSIGGVLVDNGVLYYVYRDGSREEVFVFNKIEEYFGYRRLSSTICVRTGGNLVPFTGAITIEYTPSRLGAIVKPAYAKIWLDSPDNDGLNCRMYSDGYTIVCHNISGRHRILVYFPLSEKLGEPMEYIVEVYNDEGWRLGNAPYSHVRPVLLMSKKVTVPAGSDRATVDMGYYDFSGEYMALYPRVCYFWAEIGGRIHKWCVDGEHLVVNPPTAPSKPKPKPSPRIAGTIISGVFNRLVYRNVSCDRISVSGDYDYIVVHASKRVGGEVRSTGYEYTEEKPVTVLLGGGTGDVVLDIYVPAGTTEIEVNVCGDTYMYRVVGAGTVKPRLYDLLLRMVGEELYADIVYSSKLPEDTQYIIKKWLDGGYAGEEQGVAPAGSLVVEKQVLPAVPAGRHTVRVCVTSTGTTLCREATVSGEVAPAPPSKPPRKPVSKPLVPLPRIPLPPRNIPQKEFLELMGLALASSTPVILVAGIVMGDMTSR